MTVDNLAKLLNRNNLKRSEVFESNVFSELSICNYCKKDHTN
jgi:hypothetical protein